MTWFVDDIDISNYAYNVSNRSAGWKTPAKRGENLVIPGRNGAKWLPNKPFEEGEASLSMWAVGALEDGSMPVDGNSRRQCRENLDKLTALFGQSHRLVEIKQISSNAFGIVNSVTNPGFESGQIGSPTYQNSVLNPAMRRRAAATQITNYFLNPNGSGEATTLWQPNTENLVNDPYSKYQRINSAPLYQESNYIGTSSFESFADGAVLSSTWNVPANTTANVVAIGTTDQTANPTGGTKAYKVTATATLGASTLLAYRLPVNFPVNGKPTLSFRTRQSPGDGISRDIQVRLISTDVDGNNIAFSPFKSYTLSSGSWHTITYGWTDSGNFTVASPATMVKVEIRTGTTASQWTDTQALVLDMFFLGLKGFTSGPMANLPGPFWDGDSSWATWSGTVGNSISRWTVLKDDRWIPDAPTSTNSAFHAFADCQSDDLTGTSVGFIAHGFAAVSTQNFNLALATPTPGVPYTLRFNARGVASTVATVTLYKMGANDSAPVSVGTVTVNGTSATASTAGAPARLTGTYSSYVGPTYTAADGDVLSLRVNVSVSTTGLMRFQMNALAVTDNTAVFSGNTTNTSNSTYAWSGTQYNSKSVQKSRHAKHILGRHSQVLSVKPSATDSPIVTIEQKGRADGDRTAIDLEAVDVNLTNGLYFEAKAIQNYFNAATVTLTVKAVATFYDVNDNALGSPFNSSNVTLNKLVNSSYGTFKIVSLLVPASSIPAGAVSVQVTLLVNNPTKDTSILATDFMIASRAIGSSYFDGTDSGCVWSGVANDSISLKQIQFPSTWYSPRGTIQPTIGVASAKNIIDTGSNTNIVTLSNLFNQSYPANVPYLMGFSLAARTVDSTDFNYTGTSVTLTLQTVNNGVVSDNIAIGTISGKESNAAKMLQGLITPTTSFNEIRVVFSTAGTGAYYLTASIFSAYVEPADPAVYDNPNPNIHFNRVRNGSFNDFLEFWSATSGSVTSINSTTHGQGYRLGSDAQITSNQIYVGDVSTGKLSLITWGRSGLMPSIRFSTNGSSPTTVQGTAISQTIYNVPTGQVFDIPSGKTTAEVIYTGITAGDSEVTFSYLGAYDSALTADPTLATSDPSRYFYFDGASDLDFFGQFPVWSGTADNSVSVVTPTLVNGWVDMDGISPTPIQVGVPPLSLRPPISIRKTGLVPVIPKDTIKTYRSVGFARGTNNYVSGQISVSHFNGVRVTVELYGASSPTASGTLLTGSSQVVTRPSGEIISWLDLVVSAPYYYVQITYQETAIATGYRIFLDNLSVVFTQTKLSVDYPGYFDGRTAGGAWEANADQSISQFYGGGRRAFAEVVDSIDFSSMAGGTRAEFVVSMNIPSAFWEDLVESEFTVDVANDDLLAGTEYDIENLAQTTAPIDDAVFTIVKTGTVDEITLTDIASGASLTISGTLPSGAIVIDNSTFTVMAGNVSLISKVTRKRSNQLLPITPMSSTQPPRISVKGTGSGSVNLQINARRRYMVA